MPIEVGLLVAFGVLLDALLELPDRQRPLVDDEEPTLQR